MIYPSGLTASAGGGSTSSSPGSGDVQRLLDGFAGRMSGVTRAVIITLDGLQVAHAGSVGVDLADRLAACTAGLFSLAGQCGSMLGSGMIEHVTVRFGEGHLLCMGIGQSAGLMVAAAPDSDLQILTYAMRQLAAAATPLLTPSRRYG